MTWIRVDDGMLDHPKVLQVGPQALAVHLWAMCYSARHLTDGFVAENALRGCPWIDGKKERSHALSLLLGASMWHESAGGFVIHDFLEYQQSAEKVLEKRAQVRTRQQRWKEREEERRRKKEANASTNGVSDAPPKPAPAPAPEGGKGEGERSTFSCDKCNTTFKLEQRLDEHMANVHGVYQEAV